MSAFLTGIFGHGVWKTFQIQALVLKFMYLSRIVCCLAVVIQFLPVGDQVRSQPVFMCSIVLALCFN